MRSERIIVLGVFAALALLFFLPSGWRALWSPDEGRYAEIPRAMTRSGDWVTPRIDGIKFFDKPPLAYWCEALAIRAFGTGERSLRSVPVSFGLLAVLAVFLAGRSLWGTRAGLLAAVILGTAPLYFAISGLVSLDIVVSALLAVTLLAFMAAVQSAGRRRDGLLLTFYAAAALATLAKGLIGLVLPGLVIVPWLLLTGRWREIPRFRPVAGVLLFLAIALPWHLLVQQRNPEWAWYYFVHEHFLRFTTGVHQRSQPLWFYLPVLLVGLFPWIILLPGAVRRFVRERRDSRVPARLREARLFLILWASMVTAFFSVSSSKLIPYIVPALPAFALLLGEELARREGLSARASWWAAGMSAVFAAALALTPIFVDPGSSATTIQAIETLGPWLAILAAALAVMSLAAFPARRRPLVLAIAASGFLLVLAAAATRFDDTYSVKSLAAVLRPRLAGDDLVVAFDSYPRDLPFYLERRVAIAGWIGDEIDYGSRQEDLTDWLFDFPKFRELWNGPRRVYAVLEAESMPELEQLLAAPPEVVTRGPRYLLVVNRGGEPRS